MRAAVCMCGWGIVVSGVIGDSVFDRVFRTKNSPFGSLDRILLFNRLCILEQE